MAHKDVDIQKLQTIVHLILEEFKYLIFKNKNKVLKRLIPVKNQYFSDTKIITKSWKRGVKFGEKEMFE